MRRTAAGVLVIATFACATPMEPQASPEPGNGSPSTEATDPKALLDELIVRTAQRKSFTATYRVTGADEATIRMSYRAPDRARVDLTLKDGTISTWLDRDRLSVRGTTGGVGAFGDFEGAPILGGLPGFDELEREFPSSKRSEARHDFGNGAIFDVWIVPNDTEPDHGEPSLVLSWVVHRRSLLHWLDRAREAPELHVEGRRLICRPESTTRVSISTDSGFLEQIVHADKTAISLTSLDDAVDDADFTVPLPKPGAHDVTEEIRASFRSEALRSLRFAIYVAALEARRNGSVDENAMRERARPVFESLGALDVKDDSATADPNLSNWVDKVAAWAKENFAKTKDSPFARSDVQSVLAKKRAELQIFFANAREREVAPTAPRELSAKDAAMTADVAALVEVERTARQFVYERDVASPLLAKFDAAMAAVREAR